MKQKHVTVAVFILVTGLISCGQKNALPSEYIGDWQSVDTLDYNLAVAIRSKSNATSFMIKDKTNASVAGLSGRFNPKQNRFEINSPELRDIDFRISSFQSAELVGDTMLFTVNERVVKMVRKDL